MSQEKIEKLTPEQEALIPVYLEKWRKIAFSTEPIDKEKAAEAVKEAYTLIGRKEPKILFCKSPYAANRKWERIWRQQPQILEQLSSDVSRELEDKLWKKLVGQLLHSLKSELDSKLEALFWEKLESSINIVLGALEEQLCMYGWCINLGDDWIANASYIDFFTCLLNLDYSYRLELSVLQSIVSNCGIIYPFDELAIICDRPRILSFDNQNRLHAEGAPAIQFADGYSLYAYHGVTLPEKYGKIHPNQWQASWLLEEQNAELRRVLIQGIGYSRIASELGATELDSFQEYSLLKIDTDVDIEPIYMLKMTCPSTGHIHVLRVPPNVNSAREAIRWVNWGIDPEEFAVQT